MNNNHDNTTEVFETDLSELEQLAQKRGLNVMQKPRPDFPEIEQIIVSNGTGGSISVIRGLAGFGMFEIYGLSAEMKVALNDDIQRFETAGECCARLFELLNALNQAEEAG